MASTRQELNVEPVKSISNRVWVLSEREKEDLRIMCRYGVMKGMAGSG